MFIEQIPKSLLEDITTNRCVPFIGAGFSKNAYCEKTMPSWDELGRIVGDYLPNYEYDGAIEALSCYQEEYSRAKLIEVLAKELYINQAKPSKAHISFCKLYFDIVATTNFDFLLEKAYESLYLSNGKPYLTITNESRLSTFMDEKTTILKLHGDFNDPTNMVITENDYDLYISKKPILATYLANILITRTPLLIGYSFNDPDIRMIWNIISSRLGNLRRRGYAILVEPSQYEVARFLRRGIKVISLNGKRAEYSYIFETLFEELLNYWDEFNGKEVSTSNEDAVGALKFTLEDKTLCFFSVPFDKLSLYKKYIFPIVNNCGLTPISLDEFILPKDNWIAKSEAVINKASIAIVDITNYNQNISVELGMLAEKDKTIILITDDESKIPLNLRNMRYIKGDFNKNLDLLMNNLSYTLIELTQSQDKNIMNEPTRLLAKKEYNASILAAIRLLEIELKSFSGYDQQISDDRYFSIIDRLIRVKELYNIEFDFSKVKDWISIRNQIAHTKYSATKKAAEEIVNWVNNIIKSLRDKYKL